jgi:hypothetical protein
VGPDAPPPAYEMATRFLPPHVRVDECRCAVRILSESVLAEPGTDSHLPARAGWLISMSAVNRLRITSFAVSRRTGVANPPKGVLRGTDGPRPDRAPCFSLPRPASAARQPPLQTTARLRRERCAPRARAGDESCCPRAGGGRGRSERTAARRSAPPRPDPAAGCAPCPRGDRGAISATRRARGHTARRLVLRSLRCPTHPGSPDTLIKHPCQVLDEVMSPPSMRAPPQEKPTDSWALTGSVLNGFIITGVETNGIYPAGVRALGLRFSSNPD